MTAAATIFRSVLLTNGVAPDKLLRPDDTPRPPVSVPNVVDNLWEVGAAGALPEPKVRGLRQPVARARGRPRPEGRPGLRPRVQRRRDHLPGARLRELEAPSGVREAADPPVRAAGRSLSGGGDGAEGRCRAPVAAVPDEGGHRAGARQVDPSFTACATRCSARSGTGTTWSSSTTRARRSTRRTSCSSTRRTGTTCAAPATPSGRLSPSATAAPSWAVTAR